MNKKRTIIVPIDFNAGAEAAIKYCLNHEYSDDTHIILIHTYRLISEDTSHYNDSPFALKNSIEKELRKKYTILNKKLSLDKYPNVEFLLEIGFLVNFINTMCKEFQIDRIVYGLKKGGTNKSLIEMISSGYTQVLIIDQNLDSHNDTKQIVLPQQEFIEHYKEIISKPLANNSVVLVEM